MSESLSDGATRDEQGNDAQALEEERLIRLRLWQRQALPDLLRPDGARRLELDVHDTRQTE